jgi:hypothetical protein
MEINTKYLNIIQNLNHILLQFLSLKTAQFYAFIMLLCVPVFPPISSSEPNTSHIRCESYTTWKFPTHGFYCPTWQTREILGLQKALWAHYFSNKYFIC